MTELNLGQAILDKEAIKCNIINCLNTPELDPLQRYAYANVLKRAAEEAAAEIGYSAIQFAQDEKNGCQPEAGDGKNFVHLGSTFRLTFKSNYNYNQGDQLGKDWAKAVSDRNKKQKEAKDLTEYIDALQKQILTKHERLTPTETKVSISYFES